MEKKILITFVGLLGVLVSCNSQNAGLDATQQLEARINTAIVETISAALSTEPSPLNTQEVPVEIAETIYPTQTATSTHVPVIPPSTTQATADFTATSTALPAPCYRAELIEETIPDGTILAPGEVFYKRWTIRNTGVCAWEKDFRWVLTEGEAMKGPSKIGITNDTVLPGETVRISLELAAPKIPGHYRSIYKIRTGDGGLVTPLGFWLDIIVKEP